MSQNRHTPTTVGLFLTFITCGAQRGAIPDVYYMWYPTWGSSWRLLHVAPNVGLFLTPITCGTQRGAIPDVFLTCCAQREDIHDFYYTWRPTYIPDVYYIWYTMWGYSWRLLHLAPNAGLFLLLVRVAVVKLAIQRLETGSYFAKNLIWANDVTINVGDVNV